MKTQKPEKAVAVSNAVASPVSTLAAFGLAALNLFANGTSPKMVGISLAGAALGAVVQDPGFLRFGKK